MIHIIYIYKLQDKYSWVQVYTQNALELYLIDRARHSLYDWLNEFNTNSSYLLHPGLCCYLQVVLFITFAFVDPS